MSVLEYLEMHDLTNKTVRLEYSERRPLRYVLISPRIACIPTTTGYWVVSGSFKPFLISYYTFSGGA